MEMSLDNNAPSKWRKHLVGLAVGMTTGIVGAFATVRLIESGALGEFAGSQVAAAMVGLIYLLTALGVGAGLVSPRLGAQFLNVENAEELKEQRRMLGLSAGGMIAWGLILFVLAAAGPRGGLPALTALIAVGALLVAVLALAAAQWRLMDELLHRTSSEGGNFAYYLTLLFGGGWAMLAYLGFVPGPGHLDWITLISGATLAGSFIAAGKRGLLNPR
ncbi:MAG: hypothetical protein ACO1OD_12405 [Croceibacterium sp.]